MATGSQALETLRGAIEVAEGDATTPTRLLYMPQGSATLQQKREGIVVELAWAKFDSVHDILAGLEDVQLVLSDVPLSYEDAGWWLSAFDAALSGTPATVDTSAYSRTGNASQTDGTVSATGVRSLHLQFGSTDFLSTRGWSLPGLVGEDLSLTWRKRASGADTGLRATMTFRTAKGAGNITAFTGSLSDRTQTWANGTYAKAYNDPSTMGSTPDTNINEATFHLNRPASFHDGLDGTGLHTSMHRPMPWMSELTVQRKFSDIAELDAYLGTAGVKPVRKIRLLIEGAVVGAATAKNTIRQDFVGKLLDNGDQRTFVDGLWFQNLTYRGIYDATLGGSWEYFTQNTISAAYTTA